MICKLARIAVPSESGESPRKYVDDIPRTEAALELAEWALSMTDDAAYAVIDGETMQTEYVVFEGRVLEPRRRAS